MAKKRFNYDTERMKKSAKKLKEDDEKGAGYSFLKLDSKVNKVLILGPIGDGDIVKKTMIHTVWKDGKTTAKVTCARVNDEDCPVCNYGFELKKKLDAKAEKLARKGKELSQKEQEEWRQFMPSKDVYCNAIKYSKRGDLKAEVLKLPKLAYDALIDKIEDSDDIRTICDLNKGRFLKITTNGKSGKFKRYKTAYFLDVSAKLLKDGSVDEDEILDSMVDLETLQPAYSEKKLEDLLRKLKRKGTASDEEDEDDYEEENEKVEDDEEVDGEDDDDDLEDDDEDEELDEYSDDEDEDSDDEDEDSDDEDEELDEDSDDDDVDGDSDDDDVDDEDEEEEKPKKKKPKNKKDKGKSKKKDKGKSGKKKGKKLRK